MDKPAQTLMIIRTEWKKGLETWIKCELHYLFDSTRLNLLILIITTILCILFFMVVIYFLLEVEYFE